MKYSDIKNKELRSRFKKLKIDLEGLTRARFEDIEDWISKSFSELERIHYNPNFIKKVEEFRKKWNIPPNGFTTIEEDGRHYKEIYERSKGLDAKIYINQMESIEEEFTPNEKWHWIVGEFIKFNRWKISTLPVANIKIENWNNIRPNLGKITLEIYADTTIDDIKKMWFFIESIQKKIPGYKVRKREWIYIERDRQIYEWDKKGFSAKKIRKLMEKKFKTSSLSEEDIRMKISNFKKRMRLKT